jgi:hypothetical protein
VIGGIFERAAWGKKFECGIDRGGNLSSGLHCGGKIIRAKTIAKKILIVYID